MAGARLTLAGAALLLWSRWRGAPRPDAREWRGAAFIGILLFCFGNGSVVWSEQRVASGLVALFVAVVPLWTAVLDWLAAARRPGPRTAVGLALGIGGAGLLAAPGEVAGGGAVDATGALVLLVGSFGWALGSVLSRRTPQPAAPPVGAAVQMLGGGVVLLLMSAAAGEPARAAVAAVSGASLAAVLYLILFGSLVAFSAYSWLLRVEPPTRVATYAYVNPAVAMLLGWAVLGEPVAARSLVAAAVIVAGVVLITSERR
jgi:drug/metabolite transporter (DMT)-like permease